MPTPSDGDVPHGVASTGFHFQTRWTGLVVLEQRLDDQLDLLAGAQVVDADAVDDLAQDDQLLVGQLDGGDGEGS